jgi:hypothetical protein
MQVLLGKINALVADERYQQLLTYWGVGPSGTGHLRSKNFVVALKSVLYHRVQSVLQFRSLGNSVEGRALSLVQVLVTLHVCGLWSLSLNHCFIVVAVGCDARVCAEAPLCQPAPRR